MAGNLVLIGSAANLIVATNAQEEEQKLCEMYYSGDKKEWPHTLLELTDDAASKRWPRNKTGHPEAKKIFPPGRHAKFGVVVTLLTCSVGVVILYLELKVFKWVV